jgi:serine/threonine protein kinase
VTDTTTNTVELGEQGQDQTFIVMDEAGHGRLIEPGTILDGKYLIKGMLGKGGMGCVFLALHTMMQKEFAVKVLSPNRIDPKNLRRFEAEGKVIARLNHPAIVKVHNMGIDSGDCPFYVMDLLAGVPLSDFCGSAWNGSVQELLELFKEISEGLGYAHSKGVIHRDIKPSNIMLLTDERDRAYPKIVDFGIARMQNTSAEGQAQTRAGEVFGSPFYMSPEQSLGQPCDQRSDIYSLGCTLFEVLTGSPPFKGTTSMATLMMHQSEPVPSLRQRAPEKRFSPSLDEVVSRMMAKRPADRYQSMQQVVHDLSRVIEGKSIGKIAADQDLPFDGYSDGDYDGDEESEPGTEHYRKPLVLTLVAAGLVLSAVAAVFVGAQYMTHLTSEKKSGSAPPDTTPSAKTSNTADASSLAPPYEFENNVIKADPAKVAALKKFDGVIKLDSVKVNGVLRKQITFPSVSIGNSAQGKDKPWCEAQGTVTLEDCITNIGFCISTKTNYEAFLNPEIYKKISKDTVAHLHVRNNFCTGEQPEGAEVIAKHTRSLAEILSIASTWPNLRTLSLENFSMDGMNLQSTMGRIKNLKRIDLVQICAYPPDIYQLPLWKTVDHMRIKRCSAPTSFIKAAVAGGKLTKLDVEGYQMNHELVQLLARYNKLEELYIESDAPPNDVIDEIGSIESLKKIIISGKVLLNDEQVKRFAGLKSSAEITVPRGECDPDLIRRYQSQRFIFKDVDVYQ